MQSYFVKSSMWIIQKISEKKKRESRFVKKQPKFKSNHSFQTINWRNKWPKKSIRMKLVKNKLTKWKSLKLQRLKKKTSKKSKQLLMKTEYFRTSKRYWKPQSQIWKSLLKNLRRTMTKMDTSTWFTQWQISELQTTSWIRWTGWQQSWKQAESPQPFRPQLVAWLPFKQSNWSSTWRSASWTRWETHSSTSQCQSCRQESLEKSKRSKSTKTSLPTSGKDGKSLQLILKRSLSESYFLALRTSTKFR